MSVVTILFSVALASITLFIGSVRGADRIMAEFRWMSLAAGVSVAYAFLEILPELNHAQASLEESGFAGILHNPAYLFALIGVGVFYALEVIALSSRKGAPPGKEGAASGGQGQTSAGVFHDREHTSAGVFTVHIAFFAVYNFLIGDLLTTMEDSGIAQALLFCVALAFHFYIVDEGLRHHHHARYDRWGRWVLAASLILGAITGTLFTTSSTVSALLWAVVGGGLILNTLKQELPETKESCLPSFFAGAIVFTILLQLL